MIIGIDISSVVYGTGVGNYTLNLLTNLLTIDSADTYKLFFSSLRLPVPLSIKKLLLTHKNAKLYRFYVPPIALSWLWNQAHQLPIETFIGPCDVFHTSDWTQPPATKAKLLSTIHDLTPILYPQWSDPRIIKNHTQKLAWAVKECRHFICVSHTTQKDFLKLYPVETAKTSVIYEAAEDIYQKSVSESQITAVKHKYQLGNYFISIGTREPRKNLANAIAAFSSLNTNHQLAIVGKYGWGDDIAPVSKNIRLLGYVPDTDLPVLLKGSLGLIYPSLYEGFGLPVVNAFTLGTPVITSNFGALQEIGDKSALLVDPTNISEITKAINSLLDPKTAQKYASAGLKRAADFSWPLSLIHI